MSLFLRTGLTSVKLLATQMLARPDFLVGLGLSDYDADEIALAVRDLGLGSVPETDFSVASSLESASYAMHKALQEPTNHRMAANALSCVSRIASSSHDMPAGTTPNPSTTTPLSRSVVTYLPVAKAHTNPILTVTRP